MLDYGEITGELCNKCNKVVSVEFSKKRGEAIEKRHHDKENLEVIIGDLKDIKFEEKFDYITLIGILEYAPIIYNTDNSVMDLLKYAKGMLKENGKILIATNNKFSMRNWSVIESDEKNLEYDAIISKEDNSKCQLLSKNKLDTMFEELDLGKPKYYYPLPDYKYTNVIFTNEFLPDENNLRRNMTFFKDSDIINFHENNSYLQVLKEDNRLFNFFANSYFIEIGKDLKDNNIKFVSYWNNRKPEYRLKTIIQGEKVYKYPLNDLSKKHLQLMKKNIDILNDFGIKTLDEYDDEKIISKFITKGIPYDKLIIDEFKQNGIERVVELIKEFITKTLEKIECSTIENNVFDHYNIKYKKEDIEKLHFIKYGLWDLNFQNCFYIDGEIYVYDQEWIEENLPIEFIIYRSILLFDDAASKLDKNELYKKLDILKYKELFDKLEQLMLNKIIDEPIKTMHLRPMKNVRGMYVENLQLKDENNYIKEELEQEKFKNETSDKKIKEMQDTINIQIAKINFIENSRGWKLIVKIRKLFSYFKFWQKEEKK